uniref:Glycosyl transferase family 25 domain-containing protein n=1 Tax=Noctiluca scintillans TaxID=2966 RepID=A0A7S1FA01_NOCSC|eukprot:CAMPEP_0194504328 /NCGR_PEP_ID=MMETSP0253-20130528/28882_1 /TAXON_ID=2966 /ORGANISM="Noctiluca scintillans" /LENGTH=520 /DNA_ID=CAMNT_0039346703 /DNA_START=60 /DNA_END=1622 /DNA_ORIENTATION=-
MSASSDVVDGIACECAVIAKCKEAVASHDCIVMDDARKVFALFSQGGLRPDELWAFRFCVAEFPWSEDALDWLRGAVSGFSQEGSEPAAKRPKISTDVSPSDVVCDAAIVDALRRIAEGNPSGNVSKDDAEGVLSSAAQEGFTQAHRWAFRRCLTELSFEQAAREFLRERLHEFSRDAVDFGSSSELKGLAAFVVNLDRRADRWTRCEGMLKKELPWLKYERFPASDGSKVEIPEAQIANVWNTKHNAVYGDYDEWVYDAPGTDLDGVFWKWPQDVKDDDPEWSFEEYEPEEEEDAEDDTEKASITNKTTQETRKVKKVFAQRYLNPGLVQRMSGGERGCAHSHRRIWEVAAERAAPTLALEDDAQVVFDRNELGMSSGKVFTERLVLAMREVPDFDVLYLGWSGWRGGHFKLREDEDEGEVVRQVEYVWTTVAYVVSQAGAKKLLAAACPMSQPVDNFMAWEASQGRLKSFVVLDEGDDDDSWAGGVVDQLDFQGDSDIQKSDGGIQGDDVKDFAVLGQ